MLRPATCQGVRPSHQPEPPQPSWRLQTLRGWGHDKPEPLLTEVRAWTVRMVLEHHAAHDSQRAANTPITEKIDCTAETLCKWLRQAERD